MIWELPTWYINLFARFLIETELYYFPLLFCVKSLPKKRGGGSLKLIYRCENLLLHPTRRLISERTLPTTYPKIPKLGPQRKNSTTVPVIWSAPPPQIAPHLQCPSLAWRFYFMFVSTPSPLINRPKMTIFPPTSSLSLLFSLFLLKLLHNLTS